MMTDSPAPTIALATNEDLETVIVGAVVARLCTWLDEARPGLCGRLDDLPLALMRRVVAQLFAEYSAGAEPRANVRLLVDGQPSTAWECTWTEAVRLRNPDEHNAKRPPLLLLVPPGTELLGSLDADTFNTISCETVVRDIQSTQVRALPQPLHPLGDLIRRPDIVRDTTELQRVHYLLTVARNDYRPDAAGLAFCILGLWPHCGWLASGDQREYWLTRNKEVMTGLRNGTTSLLNRVYDLNLTSPDQAHRLYTLLEDTPTLLAAAERVAIDSEFGDLDFGRWEFAHQPDTVAITVNTPELPKHEDGYPVLLLKEQPQLSLSWSIAPPPTQVSILTHYLVELQSSTGEIAYTSQTITPGKTAHKTHKIKDLATRIDAGDFIEGLYRARVRVIPGACHGMGQRDKHHTPAD